MDDRDSFQLVDIYLNITSSFICITMVDTSDGGLLTMSVPDGGPTETSRAINNNLHILIYCDRFSKSLKLSFFTLMSLVILATSVYPL